MINQNIVHKGNLRCGPHSHLPTYIVQTFHNFSKKYKYKHYSKTNKKDLNKIL